VNVQKDRDNQKSESLDDRATDVQRLLAKTSKNMNANYRHAVKKRYQMDDLEWRLQRIFKRLERQSSRQTYLDTVKSVRRLDRKHQFIFVNNYEELWSIKG
jgi:division protein CdvB (Snf7/Vps24/ESCRT-III family)